MQNTDNINSAEVLEVEVLPKERTTVMSIYSDYLKEKELEKEKKKRKAVIRKTRVGYQRKKVIGRQLKKRRREAREREKSSDNILVREVTSVPLNA